MKYLFLLSLALICLTSCSLMQKKSEEAIQLKIDTATPIKGRTVDSHITIVDTEKAELVK